MNVLLAVVRACIDSGTLLVALFALAIVPFAIWALSRFSLPFVRGIEDARSRALTAGLLAIAPGASFAAASAVVIVRAIRAGCLEMPGGRVVIAGIALLLSLAFSRAIVRAWKRQKRIDDFISTATPPAQRLASLASATNVPAYEISEADPLLFVAGIRRPSVFVSRGALARLNDVELRAALAHECAHARHGDQFMMTALLLCTDLVPLEVGQLTELYRDAREFAADRVAIESADPLDLAAAILSVVSPRRDNPVAALADACVKDRLSWLLNGAEPSGNAFPPYLKYFVAAQLTLLATLAIAAIVLPACRIVL